MPFTPEDFDAVRGRDRARVPGVGGSPASVRPGAIDQRDVLVHAGRGLDRGREYRGPWRLGVRSRLGDARRRHGEAGRRMDGGRRALLRPRRSRREPVLSVPDAPRRTCWNAASSSTARSTTSCIRCSSRRSHGTCASRLGTNGIGARSGVLHRGGVGAAAVVRRQRDLVPGVTHRGRGGPAGPPGDGRPPWVPSTSRPVRTPACSTSPRSRSSTSTATTRSRSWSGCAPTGSTGRWVRSCTRRC